MTTGAPFADLTLPQEFSTYGRHIFMGQRQHPHSVNVMLSGLARCVCRDPTAPNTAGLGKTRPGALFWLVLGAELTEHVFAVEELHEIVPHKKSHCYNRDMLLPPSLALRLFNDSFTSRSANAAA